MNEQQRREADTHYRLIHGGQALRAALHNLVENECWFSATPEPDDVWRINVKSDCIEFLPPVKDWTTATDAELVAFAGKKLPGEIMGFRDGETMLPSDARLVMRGDDGFYVSTETWFNYPKDQA